MARRYKFWTKSELDVLRAGVMPEGGFRLCIVAALQRIPF